MQNRILLLLWLTLLSFGVSAQKDNNGLWFSGNVKYDVAKKVDGSSGFSLRFDNNFLQYRSFNVETGLSYKFSKHLKGSVGYRYSNNIEKYENRLSIGVKWNDKIVKRTELSIKTKFQSELASNSEILDNTWRTNFSLTHKIKKTKLYPSIFTEWFMGMSRFNYSFNKARVGASLDFKQLKKHTFSLGYFKNIPLKEESSINSNILTIDYKFKL